MHLCVRFLHKCISFKPAEWQVDSPCDVGSGAALLLVRSCPVRGRPLPAGSFWNMIVFARVCIVLFQCRLLPVALFILQSPAYRGPPPSEWIARFDYAIARLYHVIANAGSASWVVYMLLRDLIGSFSDSGSAIATAQRGPTAEPLVLSSHWSAKEQCWRNTSIEGHLQCNKDSKYDCQETQTHVWGRNAVDGNVMRKCHIFTFTHAAWVALLAMNHVE